MGDESEPTIDFSKDADLLTGLSLARLGYLPRPDELEEGEDDEEMREWLADISEAERETSLRRARQLAGALWHSAAVLVDQLFEDVGKLRSLPEITPADIEGTWVLADLPRMHASKYTVLFAQQFLSATVELTRGLASGWEPPSCIAQELAVRCLINQVEVTEDLYDLELEPGWQGTLREALLEDTDSDMLFEPSLDGFEHDEFLTQQLGTAPMAFSDWFRPFNDGYHLGPFTRAE